MEKERPLLLICDSSNRIQNERPRRYVLKFLKERRKKVFAETSPLQVPSKFSYSKTNPARRAKQWGYSIDEGSLVMQWTKLELDTLSTDAELRNFRELLKGQRLIRRYCKNMDTTLNGDAPLHLCRNSEDIVREYLEKLAEEWWAYMRIQARFAMERVPLDLVISHPAVGLSFTLSPVGSLPNFSSVGLVV